MKNLYINKVWLSGIVKTHPQMRQLSENTKLTSFSLSVLETWESSQGEARFHKNDILIEVIGKEAEASNANLSPGQWVSIDGYLRTEQFKGQLQIKVRVYNIIYEEMHEERDGSETAGKVRLPQGD
jgi:single-stranded DNA-binding protein